MLSLSKLGLLGSLATAGVLADNASPMEKRQNVITSSQTGTTDGFYWSFWTDTEGNAQMTNGAGGEYSVEWSGNSGNFVAGKGYSPGKTDPISYTADFNPQGNGYLSLYGWFTVCALYLWPQPNDWNVADAILYHRTHWSSTTLLRATG